ncbi:MAG: hypothetical protein AAFX03_13680 [Pseudomonadota bacterium]
MKRHLFIALGLLVAAIHAWHGANALAAPGLGWGEAYAAGGLAIAGLLIFFGLQTPARGK